MCRSRRLGALAAGFLTAGFLTAGFLANPALAQQRGAGDTACARDVLVASSMQRQAIDQLEQAGSETADQCRVWRRHVETMRRVASVYGRCLSGAERTERLAQVQTSEREFSGLIRSQCKGL